MSVVAGALRPAPSGVDDRAEAERHRPRSRLPDVRDRGAALLDEPLGLVPAAGAKLDEAAVRLPLDPPVLLPAHAVPLVLDRVALTCGLEVIDGVEVDQRKRALRRLRPGSRFQLAPAFEQLRPRLLAEQEARPVPADRDRRERTGRPLGIDGVHRLVGELGGRRRAVRGVEVDELRIDLGRESLIGRCRRQCPTHPLVRLLERPGGPEHVAKHVEGVRAKHALGRRRSLLGKRTRAFDVPAGEQRGCLAELPPRVMLALARRRETYRRREELGSGVRRAPPRGTERRVLDLSRSSLVGLRRRQRQVTRALLGILDERGEALVQLPAPLLRRGAVDRRGEQRMREADSFAIADEHARFLGLDERRGEVVLRRERTPRGR